MPVLPAAGPPADLLPPGPRTILELRGVRKAFGPVVALAAADFQLREREIHGLLGGNGAGKTTLMNILYGLYRADAGEVFLDGRPIEIRSPRDALRHGIGMVHQHFLQVETFTVAQNIALGMPAGRRLLPTPVESERRIRELAARFGLEVDPHALVAELPVGVRQRVEILKALYRRVRILILDEPTTNLTPQEVDSLFASLQAMVREGISVVFITHKIREALAVCQRITVMRSGRRVLTVPREEAAEEALVRAMVGEEVDLGRSVLFSGGGGKRRPSGGPAVLRVDGLSVSAKGGVSLVRDCSLAVSAGEIFGLAGVAGNGQRELVEALVGVRRAAGGRVWIGEAEVTDAGTADRLALGVAYIPEDRLHDGFLPRGTVAQNLILGAHRRRPYARGPWLDWRAAFEAARRLIEEYRIHTPGPDTPAVNLSGGNIQRLMLARAFSFPCRLLIAHNPTRGLDVPSTEFVYRKFLELRDRGAGTLLISEDLDELFLLCDRIAVLYRGRIAGVLGREEFDRYRIGRLMAGVEAAGAGPAGARP
ncbi:MAG: ABC transporter ATP-binding protein [Armatimonadota bacterium]|nr:ABC transporter ATP-binding protein [Armatimonadota bacterium]MDR7450766.1 ABC transporter ATP-binding protein [Armatimonadota bacterium]MDR7466122.1 ABC transporter ATP-binding protein [Armatimonadota bacterium]MDR7493841.1 ABC transporter ATP-binding protein [Armatimonadota bacterium]MDR7498998.1 ABC transporter ATP-binding protein [Armatimonadota bacterium]